MNSKFQIFISTGAAASVFARECTHKHTCIYTHIHTYKHTYKHINIHPYKHKNRKTFEQPWLNRFKMLQNENGFSKMNAITILLRYN